jgi:hypothetical protein
MSTMANKPDDSEARLRDQRDRLIAKCDGGAITPAVFSVIKELEVELGWLQHRNGEVTPRRRK